MILGASGSGKSTLLNILSGLEPDQGEVLYDGANIASLSENQSRQNFAKITSLLFSSDIIYYKS